MDALISGCTGRALLVDKGSLKSFDVDDPSKLAPRTPADFAYLFGEMQDLRVVENTDIESVRRQLKLDSDSALALDLALISLDAELPDDIRLEAMEGLDELLSDARVTERLENILYARPLPEDADLPGAIRLCNKREDSTTSSFFTKLEAREPFISEVSEAWDSIPTKVFGGYDQQAEFQRTAVREGLFRTFVLARAMQITTISLLLTDGLSTSLKQLPNYVQVLQHWRGSFGQSSEESAIEHGTEEEFEADASPKVRNMLEETEAPKRFDVFISFNFEDRDEVREIVDKLRASGIVTWFDSGVLGGGPGTPWQAKIDEAIEHTAIALVFLGSSGIGPWQRKEMEWVLRKFIALERPVIPVMLPNCQINRDESIFFESLEWIDLRTSSRRPLKQLIWGILGKDLDRTTRR